MSNAPSSSPTPDPEDAWLEKLLRQPAAEPPPATPPRRDSAAFADRVLAALPPPAAATRRTSRRRRTLLLIAATLLGVGVAWLCGGAAMIESMQETAQLAQAASARLQGAESEVVHVLAGVSALAMLWFLSRRDLRQLFQ
jgi:hypothetical protein